MSGLKDTTFVYNKFTEWYLLAEHTYKEKKIDNFNAFSLATCTDEQPSLRMVLLKSYAEEGFIFYTNFESRKGVDMFRNPAVAMLFYWPPLRYQIRIEGDISKIDDKVSDSYFANRPYLSQIGAWASKQSRAMENIFDLQRRVMEYSLKYKTIVPRPQHWGGLIVRPKKFEFWTEKKSRLHDRQIYEKVSQNEWNNMILYP